MKNKRNKYILLVVSITIFIFYFMYKINNNYMYLESTLKDIISSIYSKIPSSVSIDYQNTSLTLTKEEKVELNELKQMLKLENIGTYNLEHSIIISRNTDIYFNNIIINKGTDNGIDNGMIAINKDGLVGIIDSTTKNTSSIKLLTSNEINVAISIGDEKINGILTGYNYKNNKLIVESIRNDIKINIGDEVVTNGLGKVYPSGIKIGNVHNIENKNNKKMIEVTSYVDFTNIKYISIIKGVK